MNGTGAKRELKVVLFSGGRGTHSITEALLKHSQISLTIVLNAYDDGLSTGVVRRFIPGILGPSDVRKNLNRMMRRTDDCDHALHAISEYRLPMDASFEDGISLLEALQARRPPRDVFVTGHYPRLSVEQAETLGRYCAAFLDYTCSQARAGNRFPFPDCAIGNILFAGSFLCCAKDFNRTIDALSTLYKIRGKLLNITQGENYYLVAQKADGTLLTSEAEIVGDKHGGAIERLFLLEEDFYRRNVEPAGGVVSDGLPDAVREAAKLPGINPQADQALRDADIIIYGPGTQHSSLFPSYLTVGVAEAITSNHNADKIFLANIWRDLDIQQEDATTLVRKFFETMSRYGQVQCQWQNLATHFFFQKPSANSAETDNRVRFDPVSFGYPLNHVKLVNWEIGDGRHSGGRVFEELRAIVQSRIDLARAHYAVSIIVPVLDEAETIAGVLTSLQALDFQRFDLGKEIIVVDGGSLDKTAEIAATFRGVKVIQLPRGSGMGEAERAGFEAAIGTIIATFPGDGEYSSEDLYPIVEAIARNHYPVVFGSRAFKCINLTDRIRSIYGKARLAIMVSKYGGMILSTITLMLYNKYVADLLTSVKGFDAASLRPLHLHAKSFDLHAELTAKLALRQNYILELPVEYSPRPLARGKKIRVSDGIRCIFELFRAKLVKNDEA